MRIRIRIRIALAFIGALGCQGLALGQTGAGPQAVPHVELWGGGSIAPNGPSIGLVTSYSPPLLLDGDFTSHGGQTLIANGNAAAGVTAGLNIFPAAHVGFQVAVDRVSFDLAGKNAPYAIALQYVSRQPPDYQPQIVDLAYSAAWPDTSGSLTELSVAFNALVRVGRGDRTNVTFFGGPAYCRISGLIQPLGYTTFRLGGHSVLFADDYRVAASVEPTVGMGFDAGGELALPLGHHSAIVVGYRYLRGPSGEATVRPATILNSDEIISLQTVPEVAARLALAPMRVSASGSRVFVAFKLTR